MKILKIIALILLCHSCKPTEKQEVITELLIFGHSGFCLIDSLNRIYPCDEMFYNDSINFEYDSTHLDIRQYFEFKKDSAANVAIRRPRKKTEYVRITQTDTIGFDILVNSILINKQYKPKYGLKENETAIYDGWYVTLYYKTSKNKEFSIDYIPNKLPDSLSMLHRYVENIIMKDDPEATGFFEYNAMITKKAKSFFKNFPPPQVKSTIRFSLPK